MSHPSPIPRSDITGILLAGGEGRRMGGRDKGLVEFRGRPLVEHVLERLTPQVGAVVISANRNREHYAGYGWPVVGDEPVEANEARFQGPLAGVAAALARVETPYALLAPCDVPALPADLATRLVEGVGDAMVALPDDGEHRQYAFALLRRELGPALIDCLRGGTRGMGRCFGAHDPVLVDFAGRAGEFYNLNTEEEMAAAVTDYTGR